MKVRALISVAIIEPVTAHQGSDFPPKKEVLNGRLLPERRSPKTVVKTI